MDSPSHEELIAKCPVHGRRPYNDPEKRPPFRQPAEGNTQGSIAPSSALDAYADGAGGMAATSGMASSPCLSMAGYDWSTRRTLSSSPVDPMTGGSPVGRPSPSSATSASGDFGGALTWYGQSRHGRPPLP